MGAGFRCDEHQHSFDAHDILFGKLRPYFQKVGVAPTAGICSSDIYVVRPQDARWRSFVLGVLTYDPFIDYTTAVSTGTRMPRVNWKNMSKYDVVLPPVDVADEFDKIVGPFVERVVANIHESRTLAELRDTLLPKLISGELRVPEAEDIVDDLPDVGPPRDAPLLAAEDAL